MEIRLVLIRPLRLLRSQLSQWGEPSKEGSKRHGSNVLAQGGEAILHRAVQLGAFDVQPDAAQHFGIDLCFQVDGLAGELFQLFVQALCLLLRHILSHPSIPLLQRKKADKEAMTEQYTSNTVVYKKNEIVSCFFF